MKNHKKKAQSPIVSHTLVIMLSIVLLILVITTLNSLRKEYQEFVGENEIKQICGIVRNGIEKIYWPEDYVSPTNTTMGEIVVGLPNKIAERNYRARFVNESLFIESIGEPTINYSCKIGFEVTLNGRTAGGRTEIKWTRLSNGNDVITMKGV